MDTPSPQQTTQPTTEPSSFFYFVISPYFAGQQNENEEARRDFLDKFVALSPTLQQFLVSTKTADALEEMGETFGLHLSQTEAISCLVREVVLGNLPLKDMPVAIARECHIETPVAWNIANTVAAKLLMPIKDELARTQVRQPATNIPPATPQKPTSTGHIAQTHNIIDLRNKTY